MGSSPFRPAPVRRECRTSRRLPGTMPSRALPPRWPCRSSSRIVSRARATVFAQDPIATYSRYPRERVDTEKTTQRAARTLTGIIPALNRRCRFRGQRICRSTLWPVNYGSRGLLDRRHAEYNGTGGSSTSTASLASKVGLTADVEYLEQADSLDLSPAEQTSSGVIRRAYRALPSAPRPESGSTVKDGVDTSKVPSVPRSVAL